MTPKAQRVAEMQTTSVNAAGDPLWTPDEVAAHLRVTKGQLAGMRYTGTGPKYSKLGRRVRYRPADVAEWVADNLRTGTADPA